MTQIKTNLRPYVESDGPYIVDLLNSGAGTLSGEAGIWTPARLIAVMGKMSAYHTIVFEKNLKAVVAGLAGIHNFCPISGRGELVAWCLSPDQTKTIPDATVLTPIVEWAFGRLRINRLHLYVADGNNIMSDIAAVGFVPEGIARGHFMIKGQVRDATICSLLYSNWLAK